MSFDFVSTVDYLDQTETVILATPLRSGGEARVPVWVVTVGGVPYIRSGYGEAGKWYQRALRTRRGAFLEHDRRHDVALEPVDDPDLEVAVDRAYFAKYGRQGPTYSMTREPARSTTLRVSDAAH